ncbi:MAG TPA: hypothetical protein VH500_03675 [Nitrososphaeraceae archaeon]|jgi:hypothetical protein
MNNKTIAILAIAALGVMLVATSSMTTIDHAVFAKKHKHHHHHGNNNNKQSQAAAQANVCGDGFMPMKVFCQALNNQIQGDGNAVNVIGVQPSS